MGAGKGEATSVIDNCCNCLGSENNSYTGELHLHL